MSPTGRTSQAGKMLGRDFDIDELVEVIAQRLEEKASPAKGSIGVLGSGDYGRAIAGKIAEAGFSVLIGSRDPTDENILYLIKSKPGTRLVPQTEAAEASLVILAVGFDHYARLPLDLLQGKVVVDVSNPTKLPEQGDPSMAEQLQQMIPKAQVVKAFNVLSAYALENNVQQQQKKVPVASDWEGAKARVIDLIKKMGYAPVDRGTLKSARLIETIQLEFLPSWRLALKVVGAMLVINYVILLVKYQVCGIVREEQETFKHLGLLNFNRACAITALWALALCYLPGVIAAYIQLVRGTKYKRFPYWLDKWLKMRKQLGLSMLALAGVHTCLGLAVWSSRYDGLLWDKPTIVSASVMYNATTFIPKNITVHDTMMSARGEFFLTFGVISMFLTCILGCSSLPSVGSSLTWKEFTFIQSKLGWTALLAGTVHDGLLGWGFSAKDYEICSLPAGAQYALHLPLLTIILKLPLLLPCVDNALLMIRKGYERKKKDNVYPGGAKPLDMTRRTRDNGLRFVQPFDHKQEKPFIVNS